MKKLIVAAIIFMATVCYADVKEDLFHCVHAIDVTNIHKLDSGVSLGFTPLSVEELKIVINNFLKNEKYSVVDDWTKMRGSDCKGFLYRDNLFALCVNENIIVLKEVN